MIWFICEVQTKVHVKRCSHNESSLHKMHVNLCGYSLVIRHILYVRLVCKTQEIQLKMHSTIS